MKHIILITLTLPLLSACGIISTTVGTAVKIVKAPIDILTMNETQNDDTPHVTDPYATDPLASDTAMGFSE